MIKRLALGVAACALLSQAAASAPFTSTGAVQANVPIQLTVTASSAYASGNTLDTVKQLTGAVQGLGNSAILQRLTIDFKTSQTAPTDVLIFSQNPSNTTVTDKSAISINASDVGNLIGVVHVTDCTNVGTPSVCQAGSLALSLKAAPGSTLYAVFVTRGTPTFGSTSDPIVNFEFLQD